MILLIIITECQVSSWEKLVIEELVEDIVVA